MKRILLTWTLFTAVLLSFALPAAANNGNGNHGGENGGGHTPVTICHNVDHNPHEITVDDDSTYEGHGNHLNYDGHGVRDTFGPCPVAEVPPTTVPPVTTVPPTTQPPVCVPLNDERHTTLTCPTPTTVPPTPAVVITDEPVVVAVPATVPDAVEAPVTAPAPEVLAYTGLNRGLTIALLLAGWAFGSLGLAMLIGARKLKAGGAR